MAGGSKSMSSAPKSVERRQWPSARSPFEVERRDVGARGGGPATAGVERAQGAREAVEVALEARGHDDDGLLAGRAAVEGRGELADEDVFDALLVQSM